MTTSLSVPKPLDPSLIDRAPILPDPGGDAEGYLAIIADLSASLEAKSAELDQIKGKRSFEEVVADMLRPYSDAVYWFVVCYCAAVGGFLLLAGFKKITGFELSDTVLGIISGSTAVSVIGLIGMVISGLFGIKKVATKKPAKK